MGDSEMEPWTRQLLSIIVSQICKTIGWHSISTTSLQILVDVLHRYLKRLGTNIHGYAEHFNHTHPALEEINLAFSEMGINVEDLKEYADYVSSIPLKLKVPKYPLEKKSNLNFLKPGSREVVTRPVHIHEHLPAMYPELLEESYGSLETATDDTLPNLSLDASSSSLFKKPENDIINNKRITQLISEEMGRPLRELSCVMMTTHGFLSPAREGKVAEARVPKLSNYTNANPIQPSSYPTVPPEVKGDNKKASHPVKTVNNVKADRKTRDEVHQNGKEDFDDSKIKKLTTHKEVSKLKAFKSFHNKNTDNDSSKVNRPEKIKTPAPASSPKEPKIPKPKIEKIPEKIPEPEIIVEKKLTTEPNKQKLNIFKRITKVKEERAESPVPKPSNKGADINAQYFECIEAVVRRTREKDEVEKINHKEEKLKSVVFEEPPPPVTPTLNKHLKRKKKAKHEVPAKKFKEIKQEPEEIVDKHKPKMLEIESEVPFYSMMNDIHKTLPPSLTHNPLIPKFPPNPFLPPGFGRMENNGPHPEWPNSPLPPAALMQANVDNKIKPITKSIAIVEPTLRLENDAATSVDKKLKKKMKKDKREKDKKKIKKDKLKNKEKLDKKKDKVLKKIKVKNKNKIRKEKKLNLEKEEIPVVAEDPSVPKLKLKLGNANSPQLSPSGIQSPKIVIKPIVKHDELPKSPVRVERDPSPELAKISALTSKPNKQKQSKNTSETPSTSFSKPVEPITISKNDKSFGNAKIKLKNKDKQKNKKSEEKVKKPAAFYYDDDGNQVWVCPACGAQDDGSPMIGCDGCDAWYHWVCVGIKSAPDSAKWFCTSCAKS
ncbi:transcription initiation factor TFIID subunit 3 [Planococcus citri]|uniref:transcription initiation factor TFIID subunit 3 n=1 Tax=Planococcus citri TaxID=170843 RepID=UPI0031F920FE